MSNKICAVYKMEHEKSGHYYIGGTTNYDQRKDIHRHLNQQGKNTGAINAVTAKHGNHWSFSVIEETTPDLLDERELHHLYTHVKKDLCVNLKTAAAAGARGISRTEENRKASALSMLGKNGSEEGERPVTFVSPTGKEYPNVWSVRAFSEEHGLLQPSMNMVANGQQTHHRGWTKKGTKIETEKVRAPDGTLYTHKKIDVWPFEVDRGVVINRAKNTRVDPAGDMTPEGRGWHLEGTVPLYTIEYDGKTHHNIISPAQFARTHGIRRQTMKNYVTKVEQGKPTKNSRIGLKVSKQDGWVDS